MEKNIKAFSEGGKADGAQRFMNLEFLRPLNLLTESRINFDIFGSPLRSLLNHPLREISDQLSSFLTQFDSPSTVSIRIFPYTYIICYYPLYFYTLFNSYIAEYS